jgi:hypothetical protein
MISLFLAAAVAVSPPVTCPAIAPPPPRMPTGARFVGPLAPAAAARLTTAVVTANAPTAVGAGGVLAEVEPDDSGRVAGVWRDVTALDLAGEPPHALACRYGKADARGRYATLLVPIPTGFVGTCTVRRPAVSSGRPAAGATAACAAAPRPRG